VRSCSRRDGAEDRDPVRRVRGHRRLPGSSGRSFDVVNTGSPDGHTTGVVSELRNLNADRGRVEVVPERTHLESSEFAPVVNLARGWNRQADVNRNPLFYNGTLTPDTYHAWLKRWAVRYVVLSDSTPDWQGIEEARIVAGGRAVAEAGLAGRPLASVRAHRPRAARRPACHRRPRGRRRARHQRPVRGLGARTGALVTVAGRTRRCAGLPDPGRRLDTSVRPGPRPVPPRRELPAPPRHSLLNSAFAEQDGQDGHPVRASLRLR
jgi:hypothetical protein